jgi:hypothetical protein
MIDPLSSEFTQGHASARGLRTALVVLDNYYTRPHSDRQEQSAAVGLTTLVTVLSLCSRAENKWGGCGASR